MRFAVVGVGGVGGYFGGRLAEAGFDVTFIARGATLRTLRESGLRVESPLGNIDLPHVRVTDSPAEAGAVDAVIVAVKAWQVPEVAPMMRPMIGDTTAILPLQNGVEAPSQLAAFHGTERVLGGSCRIVAFQVSPGRVRHLGVEPLITCGPLDPGAGGRAAEVTAAFVGAGVRAELSDDIRAVMWRKLLFIAPISGLSSVARLPIGALRSTEESRRMLRTAMEEVAAVAAALGVEVGDDCVERTLAFMDAMPADATPSMQRDVVEGRPSELDATVGAVARFGRRSGVATPVHDVLHAALLPGELLARGATLTNNPG